MTRVDQIRAPGSPESDETDLPGMPGAELSALNGGFAGLAASGDTVQQIADEFDVTRPTLAGVEHLFVRWAGDGPPQLPVDG